MYVKNVYNSKFVCLFVKKSVITNYLKSLARMVIVLVFGREINEKWWFI